MLLLVAVGLSLLSSAASVTPGNWSIIATNFAAFSTGVTFNGDGLTGWIVDDTIHKSVDGGVTWTPTSDSPEVIPLDIASFGQNVATCGALILGDYTIDGGETFNASTVKGYGGGAAQCIRGFPSPAPVGFISVGSYGLFTSVNGVAVSTDGGATYTAINISVLQTETRYGAFPTATTWYVTAGQWPNQVDGTRRHMARRAAAASAAAGTGAARRLQGSGYIQQVVVTKDAGATWTSVNLDYTSGVRLGASRSLSLSLRLTRFAPCGFSFKADDVSTQCSSVSISILSTSLQYLNGIDCLDESRCCAGGEQDDEPGGYGYIQCTLDGGMTWTRTLTVNETGASFLDLRVVGTDGYWAVGGVESVSERR